MPQVTPPAPAPAKKTKGLSQAERIIKQLREAGSKGVENYKLAEYNLGYRGRITELRQDGYNIHCERQRINGRATGVFIYYLTEED
jgi:hypothetical protein